MAHCGELLVQLSELFYRQRYRFTGQSHPQEWSKPNEQSKSAGVATDVQTQLLEWQEAGVVSRDARFAPEQLEIEGERRFEGAHGCERGISSFETNGKLGDGRAERMKIG